MDSKFNLQENIFMIIFVDDDGDDDGNDDDGAVTQWMWCHAPVILFGHLLSMSLFASLL